MSPKFTKPSRALVDQFKSVVAELPGVESRKMFGYDCFFVNGNFAAGLWQNTCVFKLSPADGAKFTKEAGAGPFAPMKGRPMNGWYEAPEEVAHDLEALSHWCERALAFASAAPPKAPKPRAAKKTPAKPARKRAKR